MIYGLGSESDSLPAYVVMPDPKGALEAGQPMYSNGFLPSLFVRGFVRRAVEIDMDLAVLRSFSITRDRALARAIVPIPDRVSQRSGGIRR